MVVFLNYYFFLPIFLYMGGKIFCERRAGFIFCLVLTFLESFPSDFFTRFMFFTTVLLSPFIGFVSLFFGGRWLGRQGGFLLASTLLWFNCVIVFSWLTLLYSKTVFYVFLGPWISTPGLVVSWNFMVDPLAVVMLFLINLVGLVVLVYSEEYMNQDPYVLKFMSYICLFIFFMVFLVTSTNLVHFFFAWEGVGLCSFLLISFWHTRVLALQSALKAVVINRISDCSFFLAIVGLYSLFGVVDFSLMVCLAPFFQTLVISVGSYTCSLYTVLGLLLMVGAFGKSAQLGLHVWLPEAMEGPTPISALIHAATMVTLGVFLVLRMSFLLEYTPTTLQCMVILSSISLFVTSLIGALQYDIKKIIAYSTCSQLGYMFLACGISQYGAALFHLLNHGFFKALLFLCAGNVIHALNNQQDIRKMGGLVRFLPLTSLFFLFGSLSLIGFPGTSGYDSKDLILELVLYSCSPYHLGAYGLASLSVLFTAYYSVKILYYVFYSPPNASSIHVYKNVQETVNPVVIFFLALLAILSLVSGSFFKHLLIDSSFLDTSVSTSYAAYNSGLWGEIYKELEVPKQPFFSLVYGIGLLFYYAWYGWVWVGTKFPYIFFPWGGEWKRSLYQEELKRLIEEGPYALFGEGSGGVLLTESLQIRLPFVCLIFGFLLGLFLCYGGTFLLSFVYQKDRSSFDMKTGRWFWGWLQSSRIRCIHRWYVFVARKFYFDQLYNRIAWFSLSSVAQTWLYYLEKGVFELFGPRGFLEGFIKMYYRAVYEQSPLQLFFLGLFSIILLGLFLLSLFQLMF